MMIVGKIQSMVPVLKDRNAKNYFNQYKAPQNIKNTAYHMFLKTVVFEKPNHVIDMGFTGYYKPTEFLDEKMPSTVFFDGSYVNLDVDFKKFDHVFSIYRNDAEKERIQKVAVRMGVEIDDMFYVDYGKYLNTEDRYIHGTRWLAATVGASFAKVVVVPSSNDFWATERMSSIHRNGGDWISRYYGNVVQIFNPVKKNKIEIIENMKKFDPEMFPCKCGNCMECVTNSMILGPSEMFEEDPRRSDVNLKYIRTAIHNNIPSVMPYEKFLTE